MASQVLAADDDSPVRSDWELLSQGAEARVYALELCGVPCVAKHRFAKKYRIDAIDGRLRKERTLAEARCLARCLEAGVRAPALLVADTARHTLYLERIAGDTGKRYVERFRRSDPAAVGAALALFGAAIARLHDADLTHGDLTTSNVIFVASGGGGGDGDAARSEAVLIDFGLGAIKTSPEDKAVDLYVLERALASTHVDPAALLKPVLDAYGRESDKAKAVLKRLDAVRARGRKRECFG